jgi:hypothetical protein
MLFVAGFNQFADQRRGSGKAYAVPRWQAARPSANAR